MKTTTLAALVASFLCVPLCRADSLDDLAKDFWTWRASEQPVSSDDIPRVERPPGWAPDWSAAAVVRYRKQLQQFDRRWRSLEPAAWPVARQVDYRLMGSALARVRWELDLTRSWQRNPMFYVEQSVGAYFDALLKPPPFDAQRSAACLAALSSIPRTLADARKNLTQPAAPFARIAIRRLEQIRPKLSQSVHELPLLDHDTRERMQGATEPAIAALESYREWLKRSLPGMATAAAVGRDAYVFFLSKVALLPITPAQLLSMGKQEWARSVASQNYEEHRDAGTPQLPLFQSQSEQAAREEKDELQVRRYLVAHDLLSIPAWIKHYRFMPMPGYLAPLGGLGEADDFTSSTRLSEDGTRYIDPPAPSLGYFALTTAKDPRPGIVHEGVPGHYFQLALSWAHPDFIRRHYYDSSANEGIGFYAEEMMLDAGLFDDSPRTREIIWNFMRLRALRVEVDVKLAVGKFSIEEAAEYLEHTVPMDSETAHSEAAFFASTPGQAISYQIGKLQIYSFLADAHRQQGSDFNLRKFHDFLWQNGNVPIALQRWEYLALKDQIDALDH